MTQHPDPDLLLDVALGRSGEAKRDAVLTHLLSCDPCGAEHQQLVAGIELVLPAVPRRDPPPGFDERTLQTLEASGPAPRGEPWRRRPLSAIVAALLGLLLGAAGTWALMTGTGDPTEQPPEMAASATPLLTSAGAAVGTVDTGWMGTEPVLLVRITAGEAGATYTCELVLSDGVASYVGTWTLEPAGTNTWVVPRPGSLHGIRLVDESGAVWSTADL